MKLNRLESLLVLKAEAAGVLDYNDPEIKALTQAEAISGEAIRAILLGLAVQVADEETRRPVKLTGVGLRAIGARISGKLDLEHGCTADGGALAYLSLTYCDFEQPLHLSRARVKGLSLIGSYFSHLCAEAIHIEGGLDLGGIKSNEAEGARSGANGLGRCWVQLHGARIDGEVDAAGARLVSPPARDDYDSSSMVAFHALELRHCHINGSLVLSPDFSAIGGVNIALSHIDGNVRALGSSISQVESWTFTAADSDIRGDLDFSAIRKKEADTVSSTIEGNVSLYGSKITGNLDMIGAILGGRLNGTGAEIGGAVLLNAMNGKKDGKDETILFQSSDSVRFYGARITGNLEIMGGRLEGGLTVEGAQIGGAVLLCARQGKTNGQDTLFPFFCKGDVNLYGVSVAGNLNMGGAYLEGEVVAAGMKIGSAALLRALDGKKDGKPETLPFYCKNGLNFYGTKVAGGFDMSGAIIDGRLSAEGVEFGSGVFLCCRDGNTDGREIPFPFHCKGDVSLYNTRIAGNLSMVGAKLEGDLNAALSEISSVAFLRAWDGKKDGKGETQLFHCMKTVNLYGAKIVGGLYMNGAVLDGQLTATSCEIGENAQFRAWAGKTGGEEKAFPFSCKGEVRFYGASIDDSLMMGGAQLDDQLDLTNASIGGDFRLAKSHDLEPTVTKGLIFSGTKVGGDFHVNDAHLRGGANLDTTEVAGDFWFRPISLEGKANFQNVRASKRFSINLAKTELKAGTVVDLRNAHVAVLRNTNSQAFGDKIKLELDGFVYDRLEARDSSDYSLKKLWADRNTPRLTKLRVTLSRLNDWTSGIGILAFLVLLFRKSLLHLCGLESWQWPVAWIMGLLAAVMLGATLVSLWPGFDPHGKSKNRHLRWLSLQYANQKPNPGEYAPSAYLQLVKALRQEGDYEAGDRVLRERLRLEAMKEGFFLKRILLKLHGVLFGYGLSSSRAMLTFAACLVIGMLGVSVADWGGVRIDTSSVQALRNIDLPGARMIPKMSAEILLKVSKPVLVLDTGNINTGTGAEKPTGEQDCGKQIDPAIYAADLFIPMLDLHQDTRCQISDSDEVGIWRLAFALYAVLGWIVTSITILTFTGVLRRYAEG